MLNFIVLGYIPGTTFQISFTDFVMFLCGLAAVSALVWRYTVYATRKRAMQIAAIQLASL